MIGNELLCMFESKMLCESGSELLCVFGSESLCLSGNEMLSVIGSELLFCGWKQIVILWLEANYVFDWKRIDMFEWK